MPSGVGLRQKAFISESFLRGRGRSSLRSGGAGDDRVCGCAVGCSPEITIQDSHARALPLSLLKSIGALCSTKKRGVGV